MKEIVDFVVLIILYFVIFYKKWKEKGKEILLVNTTMYIYLSFVMYFTLMPILTSLPFMFNHPYTPMNLVPFIDVLNDRGDFIRQIVLNIIMTFPFGLSLCIEILQPLINGFRSSDITDLITNVIGGTIGYVLYLIGKPLTTKILNYIKNG